MICFREHIARPTGSATELARLRRLEVELLCDRARRIRELGFRPTPPWVEQRLQEECNLKDSCPDGIGGWNVIGPTQLHEAAVLLIGQNPNQMSYVLTRDGVMDGFSPADYRALWLATGLVNCLDKGAPEEFETWKSRVFDPSRQRMQGVFFDRMRKV